jgi:FkbM family methyltransferase
VDGVFISNTLYFEKLGWNALCLEPIPDYYNKLRHNRKLALNYAVSHINSDDSIFTIVTMNNHNQSSISGLEIDRRLINDHIELGLNPKEKEIKVRSRRLDWCIENYFNFDSIDFISIDTEGNELDVLKSFDVNKYNIKLLVVENNFNEPSIEEYLNGQGWKKDRRVEVNDFYVKRDLGIPKVEGLKEEYFAEFETDRIIREKYFPDSNYKGTLIEVGGATPDYLSMSKHFKLNGWRTIVFEPNPKFVELHKQTDNEIYQCACSNEDADDVRFQVVNWLGNKNYGSESITDHSFSAIRVKDSYLKKHGYSSVNDLAVTEIQVKVRRLDTILPEIKVEQIDFLSIDVEGWEIEVLEGLDLRKHRPKVVLLENYIHEESYTKYMEKYDYKLDKIIEHNYVYVGNEFSAASRTGSLQQ